MGFSPFPSGDGRPWAAQPFTTDSGALFSLAGLANTAIAMHMEDTANNNALYVCTGSWTITNVGSAGPPVVNAAAAFSPSVADVTTGSLGKAGTYRIYPVVTLSTGPVAMDWQTITVVLLP